MGTLPARKPSGKPMNNLELVERICASSATLGEARRVGAVLARVGKCLVMGSEHARAEHKAELESILEALELGMRTGDRETRNVIAISFVYDSEVELFFDDLKAWLGPKTLGQVSGK
jgi:hypothetical protein